MDVKAARRVSDRSERSAFRQIEMGQPYRKIQVCHNWRAGRCDWNPCRFLHVDIPHIRAEKQPPRLLSKANQHIGLNHKSTLEDPNHVSSRNVSSPKAKYTWRNPKLVCSKRSTVSSNELAGSQVGRHQRTQKNIPNTEGGVVLNCRNVSSDLTTKREAAENMRKPEPRQCKYWITGNCVNGEKCKDLHAWFCGSGFSMVTNLEGHSKPVSAVVLPSGSDKLFSGSKDETVWIWDCHSGQCVNRVTLESEIQCMLSEGPWIFVGLKNGVKAWNFGSQTEYLLSVSNGPVNALAASDDMLFAGVQDGSIWAWKFSFESHCPEFVTSLKGHRLPVLTLIVGANRLYSGSKDSTIQVWGVKSLQCLETVIGHTDSVMSVLCWDCYLLSGSLDNSLKVWALSQSGKLEVVHEVKEESGVVTLRGILDADNKPILLCSYKDGTVRLYDLPSFAERGRIFAKREVQTIETGCGGLFFTGDATGQLSVWKLSGEFKADAC